MKSAIQWQSPLGPVTVECSEIGITTLYFGEMRTEARISTESQQHLERGVEWLEDYFAGKQPAIKELRLDLHGTPFRQSVWELLLDIPYGSTLTYGEIAKKIRSAPRAVGQAIGHNPVCLVVPCHRVIGRGNFGGYAGGIDRKIWLLRHEGISSLPPQQKHEDKAP